MIELIAVLVILAILALIVTPIVMSIINKARISADKRSIDAYGRSIELAIASHLLETGNFPTSIDELTIEYNGDKVVCETQEIKSDSTVYLAECKVGGRTVSGYTYGKNDENVTYDAYKVGDEVTYNNVDYYVIEDSAENVSTVKLLKATPITSSEISSYLSSTEVANKVNTTETYATMAYSLSDVCQTVGDLGCDSDYDVSDIKQVVDTWKTHYATGASEARLITIDELENDLGYEYNSSDPTRVTYVATQNTPNWVYDSNYWYWSDSQYEDDESSLWVVSTDNYLNTCSTPEYGGAIRPVIILKKSVLK